MKTIFLAVVIVLGCAAQAAAWTVHGTVWHGATIIWGTVAHGTVAVVKHL